MGFFDIFRKNKPTTEERSLALGLSYNGFSSYVASQSTRLSAVYAATNMISNAVAIMPLKVVQQENGYKKEINHKVTNILNLAPNQIHNHFNFFKLLIESVILNGNGYALIERDENLNLKGLHLIDASYVTPILFDNGVKYLVNGFASAIDSNDMIHLYMHLDSTHRGISTIKYADLTLRSATDAENHSNKFFRNGAGLLGILKASDNVTNAQKVEIAEGWKKGIERANNGGVVVVPPGIDFQSISVSPEDSQLLESRKYNIVEIARFFNISPIKLYDFTHNSYATLEQTNLSFLQDTILPYTQMIEDEFARKLFKPSQVGKYFIKFDFGALLATDKKTEAEYYNRLLSNGIFSINEIREKLGFEPIPSEEGGNAHWVQISYGTTQNVFDGAYIKQNEQNQKIDNKVTLND